MTTTYQEAVLDRSIEDLTKIIKTLSVLQLHKAALKSGDKKLFDYTSQYVGRYYGKAIAYCNNENMLKTIMKNINREEINVLFNKRLSRGYNDLLFTMIMKSGYQAKTSMVEQMILGEYSFGLRYLIRNYPEIRDFITGNIELIMFTLRNEVLECLDILYVYNDINELDIDSVITEQYKSWILDEIYDRLIEYGYDLIGRFKAMSHKRKELMSLGTYLYFHNRGIYFNADLVKYIEFWATPKTYWNTPEDMRDKLNDKVILCTNYAGTIQYAKQLTTNKKTDITIVCIDY